MINETILVEEWLRNENIDEQITYRMCYLITKWYFEHDVKDKLEIREKLIDWIKKNNIKTRIDINYCITNALNNPRRLTSDNPIRVSKEDVQEITKRFDRKNVRLCALAFLCYAKQFADQNNSFEVPFVAFGKWVGIAYNNISTRYIDELEGFGYLKRYSKDKRLFNIKDESRSPRFILKVPIVNTGEYVLEGNDIRGLYKKIFAII